MFVRVWSTLYLCCGDGQLPTSPPGMVTSGTAALVAEARCTNVARRLSRSKTMLNIGSLSIRRAMFDTFLNDYLSLALTCLNVLPMSTFVGICLQVHGQLFDC